MRFAFYVLLLLLPVSVHGLEVRFCPGERVFLFESSPERGIQSLVIQNIGVLQSQDQEIDLQTITVQIVSGGEGRQSQTFGRPDLEKAAKSLYGLQQQGVLKLLEFQFPVSRFLGKGVLLTPTTKLTRGTAVILPHTVFEVKGQPESVRVRAQGSDSSGRMVEAEASIPIVDFKSAIQYDFPLRGTWYIGASGNLHSHHRWVTMEEFALDIIQLGAASKSYKSKGLTSQDYYAYGQDVIAASDGTVVEAVDRYADDDAKLKKENETYEQYDQRIMMGQMEGLQQDPYSIAGNYVVVRHNDTEYSFYAHLKKGSVKVKKGEVVKRGQILANVGNTGSSTEPHLHFQLQDSADPLRSRALPIQFRNATVDMLGFKGRHLQSGWIITAQ